LKKRTKKLLSVLVRAVGHATRQHQESFLLLFFKKEALAFFLAA